jgi:hypothetical protein
MVSFFGSSSIYFALIHLLLRPLGLNNLQPYIALGVVASGLLAIYLWFISKGPSRLDKRTKHLLKLWILCLFIMIFTPIIYYKAVHLTNAYIGQGLSQDYLYVVYLTLSFVFIDPVREKELDSLMLNVGKLAFITGILAIVLADKSTISIENRTNTWTIQYHLWWLSCCIFSYHYFNSLITKRNRFLGYGILLVYLIFGFLVLKRSVLIHLFVILIMTVWFNQKKPTLIKRKGATYLIVSILTISLLFLGFYFIFPHISIILSERFTYLFGDISTWDRSIEARKYFESANSINLALGQGLNNYYTIDLLGQEFIVNALHIGIYDFIYKGGFVFLIFMIIIVYNILKLLLIPDLPSEGLISLGVGITFITSLFYEMSFSYAPIIFFYMVPILRGFKFIRK